MITPLSTLAPNNLRIKILQPEPGTQLENKSPSIITHIHSFKKEAPRSKDSELNLFLNFFDSIIIWSRLLALEVIRS